MSSTTALAPQAAPADTATQPGARHGAAPIDELRTDRSHPVLSIAGLTVQYGDTITVRDVDLELHRGEMVALVGGSGAGKSTVAKAVAGLVTPIGGSVHLNLTGDRGEQLELLTARAAARRTAKRSIHLVMQDPYASLPPHRRILDIVAEPMAIHKIGRAAERVDAASAALRSVGLDPQKYARRFPSELSGGERQRVAFSRAIVSKPSVILADEPTGMLDATLRAEVSQLMSDLAREYSAAILHITHDLALAARTCDRIVVMDGGQIAERGSTRALLREPQHSTTQRLLAAARRGSRRL